MFNIIVKSLYSCPTCLYTTLCQCHVNVRYRNAVQNRFQEKSWFNLKGGVL